MITTQTQTQTHFSFRPGHSWQEHWSNTAEYQSKSYRLCAWLLPCSHPPSPTMRSEKQRLLSWSKTASLAPWLSNTDLITGPGMQAGLNGRLLTQTQTGFSVFKANILSVIQHHFSCAEVGLTMPVGRCEDVREQFVGFSPPRTMSPCRHLWHRELQQWLATIWKALLYFKEKLANTKNVNLLENKLLCNIKVE